MKDIEAFIDTALGYEQLIVTMDEGDDQVRIARQGEGYAGGDILLAPEQLDVLIEALTRCAGLIER